MTTFLLTLKKQLIMSTEQMKQCQAPATHVAAVSIRAAIAA